MLTLTYLWLGEQRVSVLLIFIQFIFEYTNEIKAKKIWAWKTRVN